VPVLGAGVILKAVKSKTVRNMSLLTHMAENPILTSKGGGFFRGNVKFEPNEVEEKVIAWLCDNNFRINERCHDGITPYARFRPDLICDTGILYFHHINDIYPGVQEFIVELKYPICALDEQTLVNFGIGLIDEYIIGSTVIRLYGNGITAAVKSENVLVINPTLPVVGTHYLYQCVNCKSKEVCLGGRCDSGKGYGILVSRGREVRVIYDMSGKRGVTDINNNVLTEGVLVSGAIEDSLVEFVVSEIEKHTRVAIHSIVVNELKYFVKYSPSIKCTPTMTILYLSAATHIEIKGICCVLFDRGKCVEDRPKKIKHKLLLMYGKPRLITRRVNPYALNSPLRLRHSRIGK